MPQLSSEAKRIYEQLSARQHMPFDEVLAFFAYKKGLPHRTDTVAQLSALCMA